MGKRRVRVNDLRVKELGPGAIKRGKPYGKLCGISTRKYYDASSRHNNIYPIDMDTLVSLTELAICLYNIKEHTKFGQVRLLKVVRSLSGLIENRITFEAFSPLGVATVFIAKINELFGPYLKIEIRSVKIKCSQSDQNAKNSKEDPPPDIPQQRVIQTLPDKSLKDMAPYLSQYALAMYNIDTLHVKREAVHNIPSLKVVKAMKCDAKGTTYHVTFEASLHVESKNIETFETEICVPTLFPTMTMEVREIKMSSTTDTGPCLQSAVENHEETSC